MSAQWIIKGLDPEGASVVTHSRARKHTNPHTCPFRAGSQERYSETYTHAYYTARATQKHKCHLNIYSRCQIIELIQPKNNFTD